MNDSFPLPSRSWPSLAERSSLIEGRSPAFLLLLMRPLWRHCAHSFKKIWWLDRRSPLQQVGYGTAWERIGLWWMWMRPSRQPGSEPFRRRQSFLPLIADVIWSRLLLTWDANVEKSPARERPSYKPIPTNGSAPLETQAM